MHHSYGLKRILSMIWIAALPSVVGSQSLFLPQDLPAEEDSGSVTIPNWPVPLLWNRTAESADAAGSALHKLAVPTNPLPFTGIEPCRIADTRDGLRPPGFGPPALSAGAPRNFLLAGQCGIPASAEAVSLNITVTNTQGPGFILIHPQGSAQPLVSTLNYVAGQTIANAAIVPLGTAGGVTVVAGVAGTDLIIDTNGFFGGSVQTRVTGTCASGSSIRVVNADGTVACETDDDTTYTPGTGLSLTGTVFSLDVPFADGRYWKLGGNAGTTPGTHFVGTTDNQALELRVNGARGLRVEPTATSPNVIAGFSGNFVTASVRGASVGGGGSAGFANRVTDDFGTVAGGSDNQAGNADANTTGRSHCTVGGGLENLADGTLSTIGGGHENTASGLSATVGGGSNNEALESNSTIAGGAFNISSGQDSTVGGGRVNTATALSATVPGGRQNIAAGEFSLAAGFRAQANHNGVFAWADDSGGGPGTPFASTAVNQFIVRASGGIYLGTNSTVNIPGADFIATSTGAHLTNAGVWTNNSDREAKESFERVDSREVLRRLAGLPITSWSYKVERGAARHMGPTAQDFREAFGLGVDARSIGTIDADGVALAAIQGLYDLLLEKEGQLVSQERRLALQEEELRSLKSLEARLNALERERAGSSLP